VGALDRWTVGEPSVADWRPSQHPSGPMRQPWSQGDGAWPGGVSARAFRRVNVAGVMGLRVV